jgi:hypothetical protein
LQKRISKLKYITYKKIDISITNNNKNYLVDIWWDDKKTVNIKCNIEKEILNDLTKKENIAEVYKHLIKCLEALWTKNQWN